MSYNKVILEGRLTANPELKTTQSGIEYCNFSLAVDRNYKNGEERLADFPTLKAWRGTAKFISSYFKKGDPILVDGRLETSKFQDNDGKTVYRTDVVVESATFTISKKQSDNAQNGAGASFGTTAKSGYGAAQNVSGGGFGASSPGSEWAEVKDDDGELPF